MSNYDGWTSYDLLQLEKARLRRLTKVIVWAALYMLVGLFLVVQPYAHEHQPGMTSEEKAVAEFYAGWMQPMNEFYPDKRVASCCNKTDCSKVLEWRKRGDGAWMVRVEMEPNSFYPVPDKILEENQPDPRDSPDGESHACIVSGVVVCAVRGAGT